MCCDLWKMEEKYLSLGLIPDKNKKTCGGDFLNLFSHFHKWKIKELRNSLTSFFFLPVHSFIQSFTQERNPFWSDIMDHQNITYPHLPLRDSVQQFCFSYHFKNFAVYFSRSSTLYKCDALTLFHRCFSFSLQTLFIILSHIWTHLTNKHQAVITTRSQQRLYLHVLSDSWLFFFFVSSCVAVLHHFLLCTSV